MTTVNRTLTDEYGESPARLPIQVHTQENTMARQSKTTTSKTSHRGRNEGSLQRTAQGKWRAWVTLPNGARRSKTFATKPEARAWMRDIQVEDPVPQQANQPLGAYLLSWFEIHQTQIKETTLADYIRLIQNRINPYIGEIPLADLRPGTFDRLYYDLHLAGVGDGQIRYAHRVIHKALQDAVRDRLLPANPSDGAKLPKKKKRKIDIPLSEEQTIKLVETALTTPIGPMIYLAATIGLRQGELLALQWDDIDYHNRQIHVQRNLQRFSRDGKLVMKFSTPKSETSDRLIQVGEETMTVLDQQKQQIVTMQAVAGARWQEYNLVFPSSVGTPQNQSNLLKQFAHVLALAGLPHIRFHDLRHIATSLMLNHGIPLLTVSHILGHSLPSTTLNMYGHRDKTSEYQAACLMDQIFTSARPVRLPEVFVAQSRPKTN